jgi:predicted DNA binding CopG/RHH family protein
MEKIMSEAIESADTAWDDGELGRDEKYVTKAAHEEEIKLEDALGLHLISIRLQKQLIEDLKFIATANGIGYQPLMRDILNRFVVSEKKQIINHVISMKEQEEQQRVDDAKKSHSSKKPTHKKAA